MAINLLSYLPNTMSSTLPKNPLGMQTTTPVTMGVTAKSPIMNAPAPKTTLPTSQIAKPPVQTPVSAPLPPAPTGNAQNIKTTNPDGTVSYTSGTPEALPGAIQQAAGITSPPVSTYTPPTANTTSPQGLLQQLVNTSTTPNPLLTQDIAKQQELASEYGPALATVTNTPGLLANQNARASNLTTAYGNEMQGLGTNISALTTLQGTQQSGLGAALTGATQTTSAPYGTPQMYTATGQMVDSAGAGGGAIVSQWANYLAGGGDPSQVPASVSGNSVLYGQVLNSAKQQNPNFDVNTALGAAAGRQAVGSATGAAAASNIQAGQTAGVNANLSALNPAYSNYLQLQQTTQNIDGFGQLLTQTMQQGGINPSDVKYANAKLADIRNQLSSAQQAVYDNTLAGLRSRVSGLLAAGGSEIPSQITADATKILDGTLPLSSLSAVLTRIQAEGNILLSNAANVVNTAYSGATGNATNQNANTNQPAGWY